MIRDARGLQLSTDSAQAATLFDRAVEHYLKYHADAMDLVHQALAADPSRRTSSKRTAARARATIGSLSRPATGRSATISCITYGGTGR